MSGIAAIYHRDGSRVGDAEVQRMLTALVHRGPDGRRLTRTPFAVLALEESLKPTLRTE